MTSPITVMHLVPEFRTGGMEQGVVKLLNGLPAHRIRSAVCAFEAETDSIRDQLRPHVSVHLLGRRAGNDLALVGRLMRLLRRERPAVVHSHSWGTLCEGYAASRLTGVRRFVHGEHGTMELRRRNLSVQRWVWNRADAVLSVSSKLADRMARETGIERSRIRVIRNGADLGRFSSLSRREARQALGISEAEFVLGTVGRLVPVKDQRTLLAGMHLLRQRGVVLRLMVAGDGPLRATLEEQASTLGVRADVAFLGQYDRVERLLAALDLFVLTSTSEGLPNSVLEAMAAGLPVVATDVGGTSELVTHGETGLLVPPGEPEALAAAVRSLAQDAGRRHRMGAEARRRAHEEFTLERMLRQYEQLYETLVHSETRTFEGSADA